MVVLSFSRRKKRSASSVRLVNPQAIRLRAIAAGTDAPGARGRRGQRPRRADRGCPGGPLPADLLRRVVASPYHRRSAAFLLTGPPSSPSAHRRTGARSKSTCASWTITGLTLMSCLLPRSSQVVSRWLDPRSRPAGLDDGREQGGDPTVPSPSPAAVRGCSRRASAAGPHFMINRLHFALAPSTLVERAAQPIPLVG